MQKSVLVTYVRRTYVHEHLLSLRTGKDVCNPGVDSKSNLHYVLENEWAGATFERTNASTELEATLEVVSYSKS